MATGIDIGSNSLRAVKIDCTTREKLAEYEKVVRTAEELQSRGTISNAAVERIIAAMQEAKEQIGFDFPLKAVATAAFRKAKNSKEVVKAIKESTAIEVEIIEEEQECYYSLKGVEYALAKGFRYLEKFGAIDIGGASTEVMIKHKSRILCHSFPLGILTIIQRYKTKEDILFGIKKEITKIKEFLNDAYEIFGKPKILAATGGTPTTVAAIKLGLDARSYSAQKVSLQRIDAKDIKDSWQRLSKLDSKTRAKIVGVGREDAIMAGIVILEELLYCSGFKEFVVVDEGVREGVALSLCEGK